MNILVIGKPRARTSYLGRSLSTFYNLKYIKEPYDSAMAMNFHYSRLRNLNNTETYFEILYNKQISWLNEVTKSIFQSNNRVAKIFPRHLTCNIPDTLDYKKMTAMDSRYDSIANPNLYQFRIVKNLTEILQLKKFDKIYLIERNVVDSPISFAYSLRINHFGFNNEYEINEVKKDFAKISLDDRDIPFINYIVFEHALLVKIKEFIQKSYDCIFLDYDTVVDYVENNLQKDLKIDIVDPKFNYKNIISNYSEIENYIHETYDIFLSKVENINFI